jgi:hypothetical protein
MVLVRKGAEVFRRRRATGDEVEGEPNDYGDDVADDNDYDADDEPSDAPEADGLRDDVPERQTTGPWDPRDLPADDDTERFDLGALLVPIKPPVELRVEVADGVVVGAGLVDGNSQILVSAFAAPKSSGLWDDVRREIAESLRSSGGSAEEAHGPFGAELRARVRDDRGGLQPARFVGVDGPRWFVRGLITGPAATESFQARRLEETFRGIVVIRGGEAMAPRDPIPMHLPREAMEAAAAAEEQAPTLELTERGPEITEVR